MLFYPPCFIRPSRGRAWSKIIQPRNMQPPRPVMVGPSRLVGGTTARRVLHNKCMGYYQPIHTASRPKVKNPSSGRIYDLSLQLSQRPMNGNALMQYTLYDSNGAATLVSKLTKLGITDGYGVSTRDLRVFDLPSSGFPYILVRESTILIHLFDLRLLVQHDQVLLFHIAESANPGHDHGNGNRPRDNTDGDDHSVSRVFSHNLEENLRGGRGLGLTVSQPYELRVVEAALASVTSVLEAEYMLIEKQLSNALKKSDLDTLDKEENVIHSKLRIILDLTRKLSSIEKRARQVRDVVQEVLNEDEDMANMYLTDKKAGKPHALEDHQDVEYLFEAYFKASDAVAQEAASLMDNIQRTEETIHSTLSVRRNQIMVLEAKIEILMLALAWATLVAGWYGMNVINYSEESAHAFAIVVSLSVTGILSASWYGMRMLRRINKLRL